MKKSLTFWIVWTLSLMLLWCSTSWVKTSIDGAINTVIKKDQEKQQWFVLTKEDLYEAYDQEIQNIDLRWKGLIAIPDFCDLLDEHHKPFVKYINLASNNIKLANQDLSCLTWLFRLNLSYNNIEVVWDLWELPALKELYLQKNNISTTESFPELPWLEKLNLSYNKLKDLTDLEVLKNLITLEAAHNQLEKLIWVEKLEKLEQLKVEFNKLKDIDSILDLANLELVTAKGNELKDWLIDKLEEINKEYIETNFWTVGSALWDKIIDGVKSSISSDNE